MAALERQCQIKKFIDRIVDLETQLRDQGAPAAEAVQKMREKIKRRIAVGFGQKARKKGVRPLERIPFMTPLDQGRPKTGSRSAVGQSKEVVLVQSDEGPF